MRGFRLLLVGMLSVASAFVAASQNKTFEKISELPEAQYAYISESMLSSMGTMVDQPQFVAAAAMRLKSLEILTCEEPESFDKIRKMLDSCANELQLLSRMRDEHENIEIYGKRNGENLSSLLLIKIKGEPEVLSAIFMTGDIDPDSLRSLSRPVE